MPSPAACLYCVPCSAQGRYPVTLTMRTAGAQVQINLLQRTARLQAEAAAALDGLPADAFDEDAEPDAVPSDVGDASVGSDGDDGNADDGNDDESDGNADVAVNDDEVDVNEVDGDIVDGAMEEDVNDDDSGNLTMQYSDEEPESGDAD